MFSLIDRFPPLFGSEMGVELSVLIQRSRDKFGAFTLLTDRIDK